MSLDGLNTQADLQRWLQGQLRTPGILPPAAMSPIGLTKTGAPDDSDFPNPPKNGTLAIDDSGPTLYARIAGVWSAL
jgi:hypothetical protein